MATLSPAELAGSGWQREQARLERFVLDADETVRLNRLGQRLYDDLERAFGDRAVPAAVTLAAWSLARLTAPDDADSDAILSRTNDILQLSALRSGTPRLELRYVDDERDW